LVTNMARLQTYIRPLELAHIEAMIGAVAYHRNKKSQGLLLAVSSPSNC